VLPLRAQQQPAPRKRTKKKKPVQGHIHYINEEKLLEEDECPGLPVLWLVLLSSAVCGYVAFLSLNKMEKERIFKKQHVWRWSVPSDTHKPQEALFGVVKL